MKKIAFIIIATEMFVSTACAQIIYYNDFTGVSGASPVSSAAVDPGIKSTVTRTELDGSGHLTANSVAAGDVYRIQLAAAPITQTIKLTATVKTSGTGWIAIGFQGDDVQKLNEPTANSGPWLQFNSKAFTVHGGTAVSGISDSVYTSKYLDNSVNTFEMIYYANSTVDISLNGSVVTNGLAIGHNFPEGTPAAPMIKYLQMQFFNTVTDPATEPWFDRVTVEVLQGPYTVGMLGLGGLALLFIRQRFAK